MPPARRLLPWLALAALAGCGATTPRASTVPRPTALPDDTRLVAVAPPSSRTYFFLDLASIREARLYETMDETFEVWGDVLDELEGDFEDGPPSLAGAVTGSRAPGGAGAPGDAPGGAEDTEDAEDADGADADEPEEPEIWELLGPVEWVFVATDPRRNPPTSVSFFGARFDEAQARALVRLAAGSTDMPELPLGMGAPAPSDPLDLGVVDEEPAEVEARRVFGRRGFAAREYVLVEAVPGVWVLGREGEVGDVLERWDDPPTRTAEPLRLHDRLGLFEHHLVLAVEDVAEVRRVFASEQDGPTPDWVDRVESAGLRVDLGDGVEAAAALQLGRGSDARQTAREARESLAELAGETIPRLFGLSRHLEGIEPRVEEDRVWLEVSLDETESHLLWGRISGAVAMVVTVVQVVGEIFGNISEGFEGLDDLPEPSLEDALPGDPLDLSQGPTTDEVSHLAGGHVDASAQDDACVGWIGMAHHPLIVPRTQRLRVLARSDTADLVLAVQLEDGTWRCDDDTEGTDPVVDARFPAGEHRVYVGTYDRTEMRRYTLAATTDASRMPSSLSPSEPSYGPQIPEVPLAPGFDDPVTRHGTARGDMSLAGVVPAPCEDFATDLPHLGLRVSERLDRVRLLLRAPPGAGLVMRSPDGDFLCGSDDGDGAFFDRPLEPGLWDVWVTVPSQTDVLDYVLGITRDPRLDASSL